MIFCNQHILEIAGNRAYTSKIFLVEERFQGIFDQIKAISVTFRVFGYVYFHIAGVMRA